ncbi:MAG: hypothetical protein R2712_12705 [Vicinamibacterales bacterium]
MKKLLAGCLVVIVLGIIAVGVALFFGYRAARPMIEGATAWADHAREMAAASDRIANKDPFDPPAAGELDDRRVTRFLAVQQHVRSTLGPRWQDLETRARAFEDTARTGGRNLSLSEIGTMLSDFGSLLVDARRAHVDALNTEGFSRDEYSWVRTRVYEAAGIELAEGVNWGELESMVRDRAAQAGVEAPEVKLPEIPEANRTLVRPHIEELRRWLPLVMLGL